MNWFTRLFSSSAPPAAAAGERYVEAAGTTVDPESEDGWRRLSGDTRRDLEPMTQERMVKLAEYAWRTNLLANRLIELPLAYLLASGVSWSIDDEEAQRALDRHWRDGLNAWDIKLPKRVRELALFGEACYPVFVDAASGSVRIGYLDPADIATVVSDPENREQPIGIVTKRDLKGRTRRYRIIVNVPEDAFAERTREIRQTFDTGDCFFFRVNDLCSASRGVSDLLPQLDWLDAYDQFLFGEAERSQAARAFIWDVTLTGATPDEVKDRAKKITAPRSNSVRVHNESEAWKAEHPGLNSYDAAGAARLLRNHMLGGATIPEHWYGGAEDVNKSTGSSMTEPTEKMLAMRQATVGHMLRSIGEYVVRAHYRILDREPTEKQLKALLTLQVQWPELTAKDTTKYAAALQQVTSAVVSMLAEGLISRVTAVRLIAMMAERLGLEIDAEQELADALAEAIDNRPPTDDGEQ